MHEPRYPALTWGDFQLAWGQRTLIMGIVNMTPDSFSGDGLAVGADAAAWAESAATQGLAQVAEGADIIDVGGASSRPNAAAVPPAVESARVGPAIRALRAVLPPHIPISVDTTSVMVAQAALAAGANMLNDISGLHAEPDLARVAAMAGVPLILMANMRGISKHDVVAEVARYLARGIDRALAAGVPWDHVILDPGFGFGNTPAENMTLVRRFDALLALGRPLLLGVSRKSTLGAILDDAPVAERLEASLAAAVAGVQRGAALVRVHDVRATWRAMRVADALRYGVA
ncbi:MAG: dihydropteroate synthase [Ktedonobacterales bacterium]|nr:dihydropteroate synthase [Ktedonobacterales bacterium]